MASEDSITQFFPLKSLEIPIPSDEIRYRITSSPTSEDFFLESGRICAEDVLRALEASSVDTNSLRKVLDYGCGCSRILRFLIPALSNVDFEGCDIDPVGIEWSQHNVPARFTLIPHLPPTTYKDESFDFIYGLSVFTHLDLPRQLMWLNELHRILKPDGYLLLTVQGQIAFDLVDASLNELQRKDFEEIGFLFIENIIDGILPDWYQTAIYREEFARVVFNRGFSITRYDKQGMSGWQDLILLKKIN
jgi:SAM-dependent methyltransferase